MTTPKWSPWPIGGPGDSAQPIYDAWSAATDDMGMDHGEPDDYRLVDHVRGFCPTKAEFRWSLPARSIYRHIVLTVTVDWDEKGAFLKSATITRTTARQEESQ
jgi:hypothetical protein